MNNSGERRRVEVVGLLPHEAHFVITGLAKAIETRDLLRGEYIDDVTAKEGRVAKFQTSGRISKEYHDQARRVEIIEALGLVAGNPAYILEYPDPRLESVTVGSRVTVSGSDEVTGEWKDIFDIVTH